MKIRHMGPLLVLAVLGGMYVPSSVSARTPLAYWGANRLKAYYTRDFVGIGTNNPTSNLHVTGVNNGATILTADTTDVTVAVPVVLGDNLDIGGQLSVITNAGAGHVASFENTADGSGISIRVNSGIPAAANNFVTFENSAGTAVGRIEGQTTPELQTSFRYVWDNTMAGLDTAFIVAEGIATGFQLDLLEAAVMAGSGATKAAHWAELNGTALANVGCAFLSGNGDYAEWLEKADPAEVFSHGDIVGVRAGRISKNTNGADHYMVISKNPIVLGNMPPDDRKADFEKVAFMGQVPVKLAGVVRKGDYILPSSRNDGFGVAVSPKEMTLRDYKRIVGVAWQASRAKANYSYINTAVGINANDLAARMIEQQKEISAIVAYLHAKDPSFSPAGFEAASDDAASAQDRAEVEPVRPEVVAPRMPDAYSLSAQLRSNPEVLEAVMADAREQLIARGIDFGRFEQTRRLVTDPEYLIEILESIGR